MYHIRQRKIRRVFSFRFLSFRMFRETESPGAGIQLQHGQSHDKIHHPTNRQRTSSFQVFGGLIQQQEVNGFLKKVPFALLKRWCHYILVHFIKTNLATTSIRIVYNCSWRGWNGISFNDCVEAGAPLHQDQIQILIRFRIHAIRIIVNVENEFHCLELHESDLDFLWLLGLEAPSDPDSKFTVYRFKVVSFGAKSSPFILNSVVTHHLQQDSFQIADDKAKNIFVDNIITGCDSLD